jgi:hypothetical protein
VLQESDLDDKLMLDKDLAEELVLPVLVAGSDVESGTLVTIFDSDTESRHVLVFKRCEGCSTNYVFFGNWFHDFVRRRGLKKGDEIGFHWDPYMKHFDFSVFFFTIRM